MPPTDEAPKASHPFFWAGYLLIDGGAKSGDDKPAAKKPAIQEPAMPAKQAAAPAAQEPPAAKGTRATKATSKGTRKAKPVPQ